MADRSGDVKESKVETRAKFDVLRCLFYWRSGENYTYCQNPITQTNERFCAKHSANVVNSSMVMEAISAAGGNIDANTATIDYHTPSRVDPNGALRAPFCLSVDLVEKIGSISIACEANGGGNVSAENGTHVSTLPFPYQSQGQLVDIIRVMNEQLKIHDDKQKLAVLC